MNLDFYTEGFEDVLAIGVRANAQIKAELERILGETSLLALEHMRRNVPRSRQTYSNRSTPFSRTIYSSLGRGPVVFRPGAAGGGGFYEIEVGAIHNPPEQLRYIMEGTDRYPAAGNFGNVMAIQKLGEGVHYRTKRAGQKPQTEWFTEAYRHANAFLAAQIQGLDLRL